LTLPRFRLFTPAIFSSTAQTEAAAAGDEVLREGAAHFADADDADGSLASPYHVPPPSDSIRGRR
jgi:hypothetical protein